MKRNAVFLTLIGLFLTVGLVIGLTILSPSTAADADAVSAANQLYATGHYAEAAKILEQLVKQGVQDSVVFFNLGNAYFKKGNLEQARIAWEKALEIDPSNDKATQNLKRLENE